MHRFATNGLFPGLIPGRLVLAALAVLVLGLPAPAAAQSLWSSESLADGTLYTDQVARRKGDLLTILVKETTAITENAKTETKRNNDVNAQVNMLPATPEVAPTTGVSTVGTLPGLNATSAKTFKGEGTFSANGDVRATITARVLDVLENGNLLVEGRRQVKIQNDTKTILITGIIRTADIKADNTVLSEKMHNFQVSIEGEGPLARAQGEGILGQVLDVLWPF